MGALSQETETSFPILSGSYSPQDKTIVGIMALIECHRLVRPPEQQELPNSPVQL